MNKKFWSSLCESDLLSIILLLILAHTQLAAVTCLDHNVPKQWAGLQMIHCFNLRLSENMKVPFGLVKHDSNI